MNHSRQITYQLRQIFAVLILSSILTLAAGLTFLESAAADSIEHAEAVAKESFMRHSLEVTSLQSSGANRLPLAIAQSAAPKAIAPKGEHEAIAGIGQHLCQQPALDSSSTSGACKRPC